MKTATEARKEEKGVAQQMIKAAVISAPKIIELTETPMPVPNEYEVRIRLEGCGLCASNIPAWEGREWFDYPLEPGTPGHEGWGIVDKAGDGVTQLKEGDRVAFLGYRSFAAYDIAKADEAVRLPVKLEGQPFPGEPLACAMNILRRSDIRAGHTVCIIGAGFLGSLLVQLAKKEGAEVIAISKRQFSLQTAMEMGADQIIPMDDHYKIIEKVKKLTGGNFCDRVIEATGKQWPLDLAGELTAINGKLILAGFHQDGPRQVNMQLWNWRGIDVINAHERAPEKYLRGMRDAVKAAEYGKLDYMPLLTHSFPLEKINDAFELLTNRPAEFIKAYITL